MAGLEHVGDDGQCRYGHTDVLHSANKSVVAECRPRYQGDTCQNPVPKPYVCACVSEETAFVAQDALGEDARWYFVFIGLGCLITSFFMLLLRTLIGCRDWLRRRFFHGGLRYALPESEEGGGYRRGVHDKAVAAQRKQTQDELDGLWQCALFTTFVIALIGGPTLLYLSIPPANTEDYWVGCGFRIPQVYLIVARPEFGANGAQSA